MKTNKKQILKDGQFGFLLILPSLLLLAMIVIFPVIHVCILSFMNDAGGKFVWIGFRNYKSILFDDPKFWAYFLNSIKYVVFGIGSAFIVGLIVALSLNTITRFKGISRTIALWAWAVPPVIASLMWKWLLNDTNGALNYLLMQAGILKNPVPWLSLPTGTMLILSQVHAWTSIPFIMVILLAGLQTIPADLYEVASIDGAGSLQKFKIITFPLLRPSILTSVMISAIFAFRTFDIVFTLTGGGPGESTEMLVTYVYNMAFVFVRLGYAAALSVLMVIISMLMVFLFVTIIPTKDLS
ncbi:MAG TPA: sugar ABC transporter permease [Spirochaetia bacterium]|jgi:ABC-type sugar transport system permease subunit|nr:sugar ABC transporter permease [Spirochaetia bacterium]